MSMATRSSDLDDHKSGVVIWTEGPTLTPPSGQNGLEEREAFYSALSCSPSQSLVRKQMPDHPETQYCLEIQVISTKDRETTPPPPHTWQVPVVEDMLWDGKSGLTEVVLMGPVQAIVMGPGWAVLFYQRQSLGEALGFDEAWDTMFTLSGAISWVGKQAQLNANAVDLEEGQQLITQAIKWMAQ